MKITVDESNNGVALVLIVLVVVLPLATISNGLGAATAASPSRLQTSTFSLAPSQSFNPYNFKIVNFGIDDHRNLFVTVLGQAGGSRPSNSEQIFSYLFYTDQGVYALSANEESSSYGGAKIALDSNNCIISSADIGSIGSHGRTITLADVPVRAVYQVKAVQFDINDNGVCLSKVFDSRSK